MTCFANRYRRPFSALATLFVLLGSLGCTSGAGASQGDSETEHQLDFGGRTRSFLLHVPPGYESAHPTALVVSLHGGGGNAKAGLEQSGFEAESDKAGFILVSPDGTGKRRPLLNAMGRGHIYTWNAGSCCGYAVDHQVDDVGFIRAVVNDVRAHYAIDPRRIYATGMSNGGMMSYRLACEASDLFAAIGVVSATQMVGQCTPSHPVSVIHIHGTADQNVPLAGGVGAKALVKIVKPPVMDAIRFWVHEDGITTPPEKTTQGKVTVERYHGASVDVALYLISGGGHAWPGGQRMLEMLDPPSTALVATPVIWSFFKNHPKP